MHLLENFSLLAADFEPHLEPELRKFAAQLLERLLAAADIHNHHHVEIILDDSLRDVEDIDVVLGEIRASLGENPHGILADYGNDGFFHSPSIISKPSPDFQVRRNEFPPGFFSCTVQK